MPFSFRNGADELFFLLLNEVNVVTYDLRGLNHHVQLIISFIFEEDNFVHET